MKSHKILLFSVFLKLLLLFNFFLIASGGKRRSDLVTKNSFAEANLLFTAKLYDVLKDFMPHQQSLAFSPTILTINLALLRAATNGTANSEVENTLKFTTLTPTSIKESISEYLADLPTESDDPIIFETAQRLFIPAQYKIKDSYEEIILEDYAELDEIPIKSINFATSVTTSTKINNWFRKNTHGKIQDVVTPEYFSGATKLVLASGVYLNAQWEKRFKTEKTKAELFYLNKHDYVDCMMMNQLGRFDFVDLPELNGSAVQIPFAGQRLSLVVIVPYELSGLVHLEKKLPNYSLASIIQGMGKRNVDVYIPKFRIESNLVMNTHRAHLRKLGLDSIVSARDSPDFSKLTSKDGLHLDQVIQKVIFEIDEKGVQNPPKLKKIKNENEPIVFRADHPFIMFVYDSDSKTILLMVKKVR